MLEESCNLLLGSIYTSLYPRISNSAKCIGEFSDLICGVNMSLLIQINSPDQITFSSPSSLSSAVPETHTGILKHLAAQPCFPLNWMCFKSLQSISFRARVTAVKHSPVCVTVKWVGRLAGRLLRAQGHKQREPSISGGY